MLKKFFLNALSSFVGAWVAILICALGFVLLTIGVLSSIINANKEKLTEHSVMQITLGGSLEESDSESDIDLRMLLMGNLEASQNLKTLVAAIKEAETNSMVDAIYLSCEGVSASPATLNALRNALLDFKKSGKKIFAYGDYLTMGDYYVATAADAIYLNPAGSLDLQGLNGTSLYFKDLLDKVGVDVQAVRVGSFKSAVEPYTSNEMSEPARMQLEQLYGEMWTYILQGISSSRNVKAETVDSLVNKFIFLDEPVKAKNYKLVDDCLYEREVMDIIAGYVGKPREELNIVSPETVIGNSLQNDPESDNQIAVVYAVGDIGEFPGAGINCHELVPIIVNLAEDDNVKGMVLRVNSPGGSVFGSDQIGEALDYFKSKGKPLAVSMGDYAASGGYWISAKADIIYADPLTITGSIGIFGLVPNIGGLVDKIGVHPQTVGTNPGVMFPSIFYPMNEEQTAALQKNIDRGYEKFVSRVASGRDKSVEYIKSIAEGRVWNAIKAKELGLVDELGGLGDAVDWVAAKASVSSPNVVSYPLPEESFLGFLKDNMMVSAEIQSALDQLSRQDIQENVIKIIRWLLYQNHEQARSPYYIISL